MNSTKNAPTYGNCLREWGFAKDPFQEEYPIENSFWAGPRENIDHLFYLLRSMTEPDQKVLNVLITGEYGTGKTYTLYTLKRYTEENLGGIGIYVQIPWKAKLRGFRDLYESIIREIGHEKIVEVGQDIIKRKGIKNHDEFFAHLSTAGIFPDIARGIGNLIYEDDSALTWTWFMTNTTIYQQRALGFESNPRDEMVAIECLSSVMKFLSLGDRAVVLFIDELENLLGESAAVRSIRTGYRNLYDAIVYGQEQGRFAVFATATGTAYYQLQGVLGTAVLDRFDENISLSSLDDDSAKQFVNDLVKWALNKEGTTKSELYPFDGQETFNEFLVRTKNTSVLPGTSKAGAINTPRRIVKSGKYLLRLACEKGDFPITKTFVVRSLK